MKNRTDELMIARLDEQFSLNQKGYKMIKRKGIWYFKDSQGKVLISSPDLRKVISLLNESEFPIFGGDSLEHL